MSLVMKPGLSRRDADDDPDAGRVWVGSLGVSPICLMMIGMTIDVVENSARALRTAALGALVFDGFYVLHRLLQGLGPDDATPAGISAFNLAHRSALLASEVAVGLALLAMIVLSPPSHP